MWAKRGIKARVDEQLLEARQAMPSRLQAVFDRLVADRVLLTPDPAPYFDTLSHPLFELPCWVAERLHADGAAVHEEDVSRVLGVSALGYLYARAHDDWIDGDGLAPDGRGAPGTTAPGGVALVALADALLARCSVLLAAVVGESPRFWRRYGDIMNAYAASLLHTDDVRREDEPVTRATFERLLAQSQPLSIPSLALLDRAGRWELAAPLEGFVFGSVAAGQVFNDLMDHHADQAAGHPTWVSTSLATAGTERLWTDLLGRGEPTDGVLTTARQLALDYQERAAVAARSMELDAAEEWLRARHAQLDGLGASLREHVLAAFVERLASQPLPARE